MSCCLENFIEMMNVFFSSILLSHIYETGTKKEMQHEVEVGRRWNEIWQKIAANKKTKRKREKTTYTQAKSKCKSIHERKCITSILTRAQNQNEHTRTDRNKVFPHIHNSSYHIKRKLRNTRVLCGSSTFVPALVRMLKGSIRTREQKR